MLVMKFYEVWVSSLSFHGKEPLTYSSEAAVSVGTIVTVPLQNKLVPGIIKSEVNKPKFATKSLSFIAQPAKTTPQQIKLMQWLSDYYPAPLGQITSLFIPTNIDTKSRISGKTDKPAKTSTLKPQTLPPLTKDQTNALNQIESKPGKSVILHGDTGTGKTRVYIELAKKCLEKNKSALILTPEIGLTPQLVETFSKSFPGQTEVTHSNLSPAKKRDTWLSIANREKPVIIIGPRSALFMPINNLGLIVVDEFHDSAYKQESAPHYQTTRVAAQLSKLCNARLILGSATPNVADYYTFEQKSLPIIRMTSLAISNTNDEKDINIIPIMGRENFTRSAWLSNALLDKIQTALNDGNQSLVFLNRRGSARVVMCQVCGWQALCPKCDIPLTYHGDIHKLRCHTCGYKSAAPSSCPECKAADIIFKSTGTKAICEELTRIFPRAKVVRFDSDNLKNERLDQNYQDIVDGNVDILVGTQMLTKGLDLPKLAVVGVVTADTALFFPDYTAEEITYQQLNQVVGRVGRGHAAGSVIIQTYYPENPALEAIVDKNYSLFYQQQISERERFLFPPFSYVLKLVCGRKSYAAAEKACRNLHTFISTLPLSAELIGPSPSFKQKQNNIHYWQLVVKSKEREALTSIIKQLPAQVSYDIDPTNLL